MIVKTFYRPKEDCEVGDYSEVLSKDPPYLFMKIPIHIKITPLRWKYPETEPITFETRRFEKIQLTDGRDVWSVWKRVS